VGPLAWLNLADRCNTPLAERGMAGCFRANVAEARLLSSFHFHYARLIEDAERDGDDRVAAGGQAILDKHVRATASVNNLEGVGVAEAPRGTLIHHYKVDENGLITWRNW